MHGLVSFAHGKESGPWGTKISHLARVAEKCGLSVESPDYSDTFNPNERLQRLTNREFNQQPLVLAGSSMGGFVAAFSCNQLPVQRLFLMAPALYMPGWDQEPPTPPEKTCVVHGWKDDIIPAEHAIRYAQTHHCELHMLDSGHTLTDQLPALEEIFRRFLLS